MSKEAGNLKRIAAYVLLAVVIAVAAGFGWNRYHQRTLSPQVRVAVKALLEDPTGENIELYLRTAHLASRTKRDAEVISILDKMVYCAKRSAWHEQGAWDEMELAQKLTDPGSAESFKIAMESSKHLAETAKSEHAEGKRLMAQLRAAVGLPVSPEKH